jgi:lycopene beta-cyclase
MEKPVIILGGGVWGSLLAYRLKKALPHVHFKLYEESSILGNHKICTFRERDCKDSMPWLRPLISHSWSKHQIKSKKLEKWMASPYHLIESKHLHDVVSASLGEGTLKLNNRMSAELALQESSFVIDARNICHYKKNGYRKHLTMELELTEDHHLVSPVVFDAGVARKDSFRSFEYFPLNSKTLLVKDVWFSENSSLDADRMRNALNEVLHEKKWNIHKVIKEDMGISELPISTPMYRQEGRVINLAGIFHDMNGCSIPMAVKVIDRMVKTSFRFGELREVVQQFRKENETDRLFLRFFNRLLLEQKQYQVFEWCMTSKLRL